MKDKIKVGDTVINKWGCIGVVTKRYPNGRLFFQSYQCSSEDYNESELKLRYKLNNEEIKDDEA